ncbi:transposase for insertion sequence element IS1665 [Yersinia enterocolitica subsp. enterocolitica 8081]|uniref:Transposase for insertion sequence element IS1665 n=1 Tax=Yersinia enterocolitica serotype O:8 / biotype 1B (strain NCTC 13174 / 8081) TaxID=393305 RepID=A1JTC9_YERE8|nr:transposase for insertion sequence element IS1665 [Yersinia enterocolitica subsp. enterocolitica 8081]
MHIAQALDLVSRYDSLRNPLTTLGDYLDPELISRCLAESGTVTLRKRRLPLEMMVWCIVGMALERKEPLHQIVNRLDIMLPGDRPFVAPSAVIQARQRLGSEAVRRVFSQTAQLWHGSVTHPHWCGLTLLAVDGVVWRTDNATEQADAAEKKPELVEQELWGVLLGYNLVRYQMIKMARALKGYWPNQLSFSESCGMVMRMLMTLQGASPGRIPELMRDMESMAQMVKLPIRRERAFPRVVKERPYKYGKARNKNASQLLN